MAPTLQDGDWLLVDPDAYRVYSPQAGDLVVAADPRKPDWLLVKRVTRIDPDGRLTLAGDHPAHASADEEDMPPIPRGALRGRPWFRYWPLVRVGRTR